MKVTRTPLLFTLAIFWALIILALGVWWLYLLHHIQTINYSNLTTMIKWEGGTFIILLLLLSGTLWYIYLKERAYTHSLTSFFAGVTHELKTPLASISLQAEAIETFLESGNRDHILRLTKRLTEDTRTLENQLDKLLQLSRVERGGKLTITPLLCQKLIKDVTNRYRQEISFTLTIASDLPPVLADHYALELILKNLIENTKRHAKTKMASIALTVDKKRAILLYSDDGHFEGDANRIGDLFYKHNSNKGSGIGLYLIKRLSAAMDGRADFYSDQSSFKVLINLKLDGGNA